VILSELPVLDISYGNGGEKVEEYEKDVENKT
jgi:hypothetical protein